MMETSFDIAVYLAVAYLLGFAAWPWLFGTATALADRGLTLSRLLALTLSAIFSFNLAAWSGLPLRGVWAALAPVMLLAFGAWGFRRRGREILTWIGQHRRRYLFFELGFGGLFIFCLSLRALQPAIFGEEKFPDFAIFNSLLRSRQVPPPDPWLAGEALNYYYFNHFAQAWLTGLLRLRADLGYHLALAFNQALLFFLFLSAAAGRLRRFWLALALAAWLIFGGNLVWLTRLCGSTDGMAYWWQASRAIPATINEFPYFSFLLGDLHAHYTSLPVALALLLSLWQVLEAPAGDWARRRRFGLLAALLLGVLSAANPWEIPFFLMLTLASALWLLWQYQRAAGRLSGGTAWRILGYGAVWLSLVLLPLLVFHLAFQSPLGSIPGAPLRLVPWRLYSSTGRFLSHFGLLLLLPLGYLARRLIWTLGRRGRLALAGLALAALALWQQPVWLLLLPLLFLTAAAVWRGRADRGPVQLIGWGWIAALVMLIGVEFFSINDFYAADNMRLNTVFKVHYQIWLFLGLLNLLVLAEEEGRRVIRGFLLLILLAALVYPAAGTYDRVSTGPPRQHLFSLDGLSFLRQWPLSDDLPCVLWVRDHLTSADSLVEATGPPFQTYSRFSAMSGVPTYLGWINHELVWRGLNHFPMLKQRHDQIEALYRASGPASLRAAAARIPAGHIMLGLLERSHYRARPELFLDTFPAAFLGPDCAVLRNAPKK